MMRGRTIALFVCLLILGGVTRCDEPTQDWTHYVRIGAYGLSATNADEIIQDARASHVFGIEVDNDVTGRYDSFLDPAEKLQAIHTLVEKAHAVGNKAFVYIAGTECITANAEKSPHSVLKDHPDWLQRKLTGEPAVFASEAAFWIKPGDEDVWISPYAAPWRKIYMERVRQIAATGIDGIYVDIPYWMTHFDGWEDSWASFDDFTIAAFRQKTGLDGRKDLKLGDLSDANFRKWVEFRIDTLTEFVREIRENTRAVNPATVVIPEIYPGIEQEATRVGADVYEMYGVVDAVAHEKILYAHRLPIRPVGVYFSPASRNFDAPRFLASYRGTLLLLLENHIEFQIVTPRTLPKFRGSQLILPDVSFLTDAERSQLKNFLVDRGRLMISAVDST